GKTLLAKAAAANLQATFFEARLPALLSKYYGESTKLVSALFAKAREKAPAIVFIDEIDALAQSREESSEATRRVLGQFLQELEGFSSGKEQVLVIGATNKPWALDDALLSRFERKIAVPLPDPPAREAILAIHLRGASADPGLRSGLVARTEGFSGRDLANLCHEAILHMVREQNPQLDRLGPGEVERYKLAHRQLTDADFTEALQKVRPGDLDLAKYAEWGREFGE
ncbi:MAG TPA: ATP-binding protein, partial [archaeon]|nr:ATP-binding protein [archaeon]